MQGNCRHNHSRVLLTISKDLPHGKISFSMSQLSQQVSRGIFDQGSNLRNHRQVIIAYFHRISQERLQHSCLPDPWLANFLKLPLVTMATRKPCDEDKMNTSREQFSSEEKSIEILNLPSLLIGNTPAQPIWNLDTWLMLASFS